MNVHRCPGLAPRPLAGYLAALGLAKVVGEQADPDVRFGWSGGTFVVRTVVEDLVDFLVAAYSPTPVISPWNGGSGFGNKDKGQRELVDQLGASPGERLADYRATMAAARYVFTQPGSETWDKERLVQQLRNWLPDRALTWLDCAVVLTADRAVFPPLVGTGGNDGRLEFSSNFHQRLFSVLPELGANPARSRAWARDALAGTAGEALVGAAVGQFDPAAAGGPGSSAHGAGESLVNPWSFVLMVEGLTWFASAPARRLGETSGKAAMPFTVGFSADGPIPGAADEEARGEFWAPVVESVSLSHLRQIIGEARTAWQGESAQSVPKMYAAVHSFGVDRGIQAFERYGLLQRNGLAYVAAPLDRVEVRLAPEVSLALHPMRRADEFRKAEGAATRGAARRFDSAVTAYLREPTAAGLVALLAAQTRLELTAMRAEGNHGELRRPGRLADASSALTVLRPILEQSPEARVAAGLASAYTVRGARPVSLRELLVGTDPGDVQARPVAAGLGRRAAIEVLADAAVWLAQHPVDDPRVQRGWLPMRGHRYRTHWPDVHAWIAGGRVHDGFDDGALSEFLLALLALDWSEADLPGITPQPLGYLDPDVAVLQAFTSGQVIGVGVSAEGTDGRVGLRHDWPMRLRAGHVDPVRRESAALLGRSLVRVGAADSTSGRRFVRRVADTHVGDFIDQHRGTRLAAVLLAPASTGAIRRIATPGDQPLNDNRPNHEQGALA